jgi:hypothetical protein
MGCLRYLLVPNTNRSHPLHFDPRAFTASLVAPLPNPIDLDADGKGIATKNRGVETHGRCAPRRCQGVPNVGSYIAGRGQAAMLSGPDRLWCSFGKA